MNSSETLSWWRRLAAANPARALSELRGWQEELLPHLDESELGSLYTCYYEEQPFLAIEDFRFASKRIQSILLPSFRRNWKRTVRIDSSQAIRLLSRMGAEEVSLLPVEEIEAAWQETKVKDPATALRSLSALPPLVLRRRNPAEIADIFRCLIAQEATTALVVLPEIPSELRSAISSDEIRRSWKGARQSIYQHGKEHGALWMWEKANEMPAEVLEAIDESELGRTWEAVAQVRKFEESIDDLLRKRKSHSGRDRLFTSAAPSIAAEWRRFSRRGSASALDLLLRLPEEAQDLISSTDIDYAWQRLAKRNRWEATQWLTREPVHSFGRALSLESAYILLQDKEPASLLSKLPQDLKARLEPGPIKLAYEKALRDRRYAAALDLLEEMPNSALSEITPTALAPLLEKGDAEIRTRSLSLLHRLGQSSNPSTPASPTRSLR